MPLSVSDRFALLVQREVGRLLGPIWIPAGAAVLRWWYGWRIVDAGAARREFRRLRRESPAPLLVCANHLTMVDSFLIAIALASPWWYVAHFAALPWNMPERDNFSRTWWLRIATYVMKCIPVERGGDRREIGRTVERFSYLLSRGDVGLIFPEGGRSRSGRVDLRGLHLRCRARGEVAARLPGAVRLPARRRADELQRRAGARRTLPRALRVARAQDGARRDARLARDLRGRSWRASQPSKRTGSMLGNDIIDLGDPETRPGARHPRFDARVFTREERAALGDRGGSGAAALEPVGGEGSRLQVPEEARARDRLLAGALRGAPRNGADRERDFRRTAPARGALLRRETASTPSRRTPPIPSAACCARVSGAAGRGRPRERLRGRCARSPATPPRRTWAARRTSSSSGARAACRACAGAARRRASTCLSRTTGASSPRPSRRDPGRARHERLPADPPARHREPRRSGDALHPRREGPAHARALRAAGDRTLHRCGSRHALRAPRRRRRAPGCPARGGRRLSRPRRAARRAAAGGRGRGLARLGLRRRGSALRRARHRGRHPLPRPLGRGHAPAGGQDLRQGDRGRLGRAGLALERRRGRERGPGGRARGAHRLPGGREGHGGRRRARHPRRRAPGRSRRRVRVGRLRGAAPPSATGACSSNARSPAAATSRSRSPPTRTAWCWRSAAATARCSADTRRCSKRRRRPGSPRSLLAELSDAAVRIAQKVGYSGVGTVEFLVSDAGHFFLEMNPRLQVEHGVTESLTGIDLVQLQIRIARGETLALLALREEGFAIEARVCAEDPDAGFLPAPGRIARFDPALGPRVRIDTGVTAGSAVPAAFDSLIAKVIATGDTREEARSRLFCALTDFDLVIAGGATNKGFLLDVLTSDDYRRGGVDTDWLDRFVASGRAEPGFAVEALIAAGILSYQAARADGAAELLRRPDQHLALARPALDGAADRPQLRRRAVPPDGLHGGILALPRPSRRPRGDGQLARGGPAHGAPEGGRSHAAPALRRHRVGSAPRGRGAHALLRGTDGRPGARGNAGDGGGDPRAPRRTRRGRPAARRAGSDEDGDQLRRRPSPASSRRCSRSAGSRWPPARCCW